MQQTDTKEVYNLAGKMIYWELCKKLKLDPTNKWYNAQSRICPRKWDSLNSEILRYNKSLNSGQKARPNAN